VINTAINFREGREGGSTRGGEGGQTSKPILFRFPVMHLDFPLKYSGWWKKLLNHKNKIKHYSVFAYKLVLTTHLNKTTKLLNV